MLSGLGGPSDVGFPTTCCSWIHIRPFTKSHRDTYLQSLYLLSYPVLAAKMKRSTLFMGLVLSNRVSNPRETTYCWFPGLLDPVGEELAPAWTPLLCVLPAWEKRQGGADCCSQSQREAGLGDCTVLLNKMVWPRVGGFSGQALPNENIGNLVRVAIRVRLEDFFFNLQNSI